MPHPACANGLQLHDILQEFTEHTAIGEKSDFFTNPIHNNACHEMIWWPLQSKWSTCQCSSNTRSHYRHTTSHA